MKPRLLPLLFSVLLFSVFGAIATGVVASRPAYAGAWCGGSTSNGCACGKVNIYPCCSNDANCTWYAWRSMCCHWNFGPGNWGNANTWAGNAKKNPDVQWLAGPVVGAVATRDLGKFGHVAYVVEVSGGKVRVEEQNCDYGKGGVLSTWYTSAYFNTGYLVKKGSQNQGPSCGNGKCEGGENCSTCAKDCGDCCGNGKCEGGENCSTCGKDCGGCCGNGKCDYGETCGSCTKDCLCLPEGALATATCGLVSGWALDANVPDKKLDVRIKVNGALQSQTTASGSFPGHEGRGFAWVPSPEFKQGQVCKVTAEAQDADQDAFSTFGPRSFLCDNATSQDGIWTTTRQDAAGISVHLPPGAHQGLQHAHPAGCG